MKFLWLGQFVCYHTSYAHHTWTTHWSYGVHVSQFTMRLPSWSTDFVKNMSIFHDLISFSITIQPRLAILGQYIDYGMYISAFQKRTFCLIWWMTTGFFELSFFIIKTYFHIQIWRILFSFWHNILLTVLKENSSQLNNCYNSIHCNFLFVNN